MGGPVGQRGRAAFRPGARSAAARAIHRGARRPMSAPSRADGATRALGEPLTFWRPDPARAPADPPRISVADLVSFLGKGGPRHGRSLVHGVASLPAWHAIHTSPSGERDTIPALPFSDLPPRLPALADAAGAVRRAVRDATARAAGDARRIGLQLSGGL